MTNMLLLQKARDAARYSIGVCLTPVAVLGVTTIALTLFAAEKIDGLIQGRQIGPSDQKSGFS